LSFSTTRLLALTLVLLAGSQPALRAQTETPTGSTATQREIERLLSGPALHIGEADILAQEQLLEAYRENAFEPFWTDPARVEELLRLIDSAADHGLNPADYGRRAIAEALSEPLLEPDPTRAGRRDILLSESLFRYGYHRRFGKIKASTLDPDINYRRDTFQGRSAGANLRQALLAPSLESFIDLVAPAGPVYKALQAWLAHYRKIEAAGGWPAIPAGPTLHPGDEDPRVALIRNRLSIGGGHNQDGSAVVSDSPDRFDADLKKAVQRFQRHHALIADGVVGKQTLEAMNVSVQQRINQLRLSLERLRWVNQEASDTLIAVNIAGFRAFYVRDGVPTWETRAMVGRTYRQTPTFRSDLAYMEFNPTWTIPPTILKNDTLPAIRRDPQYLARNNIVVLDYDGRPLDADAIDWDQYQTTVPFLLRQQPGPDNALGRVKFIFPNPHAVFLHDTPHQELFDQPERAFSSGCIRIEHPLELAALLLGDNSAPPLPDLQGIIQSGETQRIHLTRPVPVLIVYLTASIDDDGSLLFYRDIYKRDDKALEALDGPVVLDPPSSG
jgi:murein L,D-transpeptidase YcbB/YkuD